MASASTAIRSVANSRRPELVTIYFKEAKYEFLKCLRVPMYSVSTMLLPIMFYVLFGLVMGRQMIGGISTTMYLIPSYGTFGVMGASLFGTAASLAGERGLGWLQVKRASPMPPFAYFVAKIVMSVIFGTVDVLLLLLLGVIFGGVHLPAMIAAKLVLTLVAGSIPFCAMGLAIGYFAGPTSAPAIINLFYLPMSFCSGLWMPDYVSAEIHSARCRVSAPVSPVATVVQPHRSGARRSEPRTLGSVSRIHHDLPGDCLGGTSARSEGKWMKQQIMSSNWMGWLLVVAAVVLLLALSRLDLLLIVAPLSLLVSYAFFRTELGSNSGPGRIERSFR